ncbi:hypothetical protein B566_EDAN014257 [Ephemera danica]|nr:hypothetical protein B566_EDAN014257 [Ephemera danica]
MEIKLSRIDYALVGSTSRQTMKILPNSAVKTQQKIALGDHDGVVQIFSIKKGEIQQHFKSLPGRKITRVELGGPAGTTQDKIFISSENEVKGYTKKGKLFLGFDTNLTETIQHMSVCGSHLMVAGKHTFHHYEDCIEKRDVTFADNITDIVTLPQHQGSVRTVIACEDRTLRIVKDKERPEVIELPGRPSALQLLLGHGGDSGDDILYGTQDGSIGLVSCGFQPSKHWVMESTNGGVMCMDHFDLTGDGVSELLVGRDDGTIEAYAFDEMQDVPVRRVSHSCNESIMSIQGGMVGSPEHEEIVATTYTGTYVAKLKVANNHKNFLLVQGWLFGLTTENKERDMALKEDSLEQTVVKEREKYQEITRTKSEAVSAIPYISVNDKFTLHRSDASYSLTIEVQTAIDNVLIQSNIPVDILDVEKNSAVVSYSECDPKSGNYLLATYRCQVNTTRLEVKVRTVEGQSGELRAYITLNLQPKCCQVRCYPIRPLSLHARSHELELGRPYNSLCLAGNFSLAEVHSWISMCLPEVPEKVPITDEGVLTFTNTFLNTILHCMYTKGKAEFKSDNMSTIAILRDVLTKEATKKKIKLEISCEMDPRSTGHMLQLLHPQLESKRRLSRDAGMLEALRELKQCGAELPPKYQRVLDEEAQLANSLKQPSQLERLTTMVTDLYMDIHKFHGNNVKSRVPQLLEILNKYSDVRTLIDFFENT